MEVEDISLNLSKVIDKEKLIQEAIHKKINVGFNNDTMVYEIVEMMFKILNKETTIIKENGGCNFSFPKEEFEKYLKEMNYEVPENYTYNLLKKYL